MTELTDSFQDSKFFTFAVQAGSRCTDTHDLCLQVAALTKSFKDGEPFTYIIDADLKLKAGAASEAPAVVDASEAIIDVEAN